MPQMTTSKFDSLVQKHFPCLYWPGVEAQKSLYPGESLKFSLVNVQEDPMRDKRIEEAEDSMDPDKVFVEDLLEKMLLRDVLPSEGDYEILCEE